MTLPYVYYFIVALIEAIILFVFTSTVLPHRSAIRCLLCVGLGGAVAMGLIMINRLLLVHPLFTLFPLFIADFVTLQIAFYGRSMQKAQLITHLYCLNTVIEIITIPIMALFTEYPVDSPITEDQYQIIATVITKMISAVVLIFYRKHVSPIFRRLTTKHLIYHLTVNISILLIVFYIIPVAGVGIGYEKSLLLTVVIAGVGLALAVAIITMFSNKTQEQQQIKAREADAVSFNRSQQAIVAYLSSLQNDLAKERHDMLHQVDYITSLTRTGQQIEIDYLLKVANKVPVDEVRYTGNTMINIIIFGKAEQIEKSNIELVVNGDLPSILNFDIIHMSSLLGNILDNAINACNRTGRTAGSSTITLFFHYNPVGSLKIVTTNPTIEVDTRNFHGGFGLEKIRDIATLYRGFVQYEVRESLALVSVYMREPD